VSEAYGAQLGCSARLLRNNLPMDPTDREILRQLQDDGRLPNAALAERVHLSPSPSLRRLRRLEKDGTIRGYRAILDRRRVGLGLTVFVEVKLTGHSQQRAEEFGEAVAGIDAVVACHIVAGMADFLLEVVVPDLAAYEQLLLETLLELPGVTDVRSNVAIRTVKEAGPLPLDQRA
jgi:Lrp/AsnC family transcriptional regulator, leucine-responsive regulatory protein